MNPETMTADEIEALAKVANLPRNTERADDRDAAREQLRRMSLLLALRLARLLRAAEHVQAGLAGGTACEECYGEWFDCQDESPDSKHMYTVLAKALKEKP